MVPTISKEDFMTLSDTQLLILSAASQRADHAATLPANLKGSAAKKVIDRLLKQKLLQELHARDDMPVWRRGDDNRPYTLRITNAGLKVIEVEDVANAPDNKATVRPNEVVAAKTATETKSSERPTRAKRSSLKKRAAPSAKAAKASPGRANRIRLSPCFDSREAQPWMGWSKQPDGKNTRCAAFWPGPCARS
jgi:hypothetical protein